MELRPLYRRYGRGIARLPVGTPPGSTTLTELAQIPSAYERRLALVPIALATILALSLGLSPSPLRNVSETELALAPTPLEIEFWEEASERPPPPAEPPAAEPTPIQVAEPIPFTAPSDFVSEPIDAPPILKAKPFDPSALALAPAPPVLNREVHSQARPSSPAPKHRPRPTLGRSSGTDTLSMIAERAAPIPTATPYLTTTPGGATEKRRAAGTTSARPGRSSARSDRGLVRAVPGGSPRSQFLAGLEAEAKSGGHTGAGTSGSASLRPSVAAASREIGHQIRNQVAAHATHDGWYQVPLEELPDCSPPGRQDELKKQILLASTGERECTHQDGSYRFLETRNLNAFLMWSRINPDSSAKPRAARDVCDVLLRALRCLGQPSIEELGIQ